MQIGGYCFYVGFSIRHSVQDHSLYLIAYPASFRQCIHLLVCLLLIVLVVYGIELTGMVHAQESPAMEIRMSYVYSAIPVSASLMLISYLFETWDRFFELPFFSGKGSPS